MLNVGTNNEPTLALPSNYRDHIPDADRNARRIAQVTNAAANAAEARAEIIRIAAENRERAELREREVAERAIQQAQGIAANLVATEQRRVDVELLAIAADNQEIRSRMAANNERLREQILFENEVFREQMATENDQLRARLASDRERLENEHIDRLLAIDIRENQVEEAFSNAVNRQEDVASMIEGWHVVVPAPHHQEQGNRSCL